MQCSLLILTDEIRFQENVAFSSDSETLFVANKKMTRFFVFETLVCNLFHSLMRFSFASNKHSVWLLETGMLRLVSCFSAREVVFAVFGEVTGDCVSLVTWHWWSEDILRLRKLREIAQVWWLTIDSYDILAFRANLTMLGLLPARWKFISKNFKSQRHW